MEIITPRKPLLTVVIETHAGLHIIKLTQCHTVCLRVVLEFLHCTCVIFSHTEFVSRVHTVVDVAEEVSVLVYDVDTVVVVRRKDVPLAICGDAEWTE